MNEFIDLVFVKLINGEDVVGKLVKVDDENITLEDVFRVFYMQDKDGRLKFTMGTWIPADSKGDCHIINSGFCIVITPCKGDLQDLYYYFYEKTRGNIEKVKTSRYDDEADDILQELGKLASANTVLH